MKNKTYQNVQSILKDFEVSRDDTNFLWFSYLNIYCGVHGVDPIDKLYLGLKNKTIPLNATLERYSRQIQERNPHLRGKEWVLRQTNKQSKAKKDLGY